MQTPRASGQALTFRVRRPPGWCAAQLRSRVRRILDQPLVLFPPDRNLIQAGSENNYCILRVVIIGRDMIECVHAY